MREFMTKVSDYISERRNDPENNGNFFVFCTIGIAILVIVILCLLLLWKKSSGKDEQEVKTETFTETIETVMSGAPADENLKQQYLDNIEYLGERVKELMESMTQVKETLEEAVTIEQKDNTELQKQVSEITGDIKNLIVRLDNTQNELYDLSDIVNVMNTETIPVIQAQISAIEEQMKEVNTDISDIYSKIDALETTDEQLQARIDKIEGSLKESVEQSMTNITNQFTDMSTHIKQIEAQVGDSQTQIENLRQQIEAMQTQMQSLTTQFLRYRYDADTNTLYLTTD